MTSKCKCCGLVGCEKLNKHKSEKCKTCEHEDKDHPKIKHETGRWKGRIRSEDCLVVTDYKKCPCEKFTPEDEIVQVHVDDWLLAKKKEKKGCGKKVKLEKDKKNIYTCGEFYAVFGRVYLCSSCSKSDVPIIVSGGSPIASGILNQSPRTPKGAPLDNSSGELLLKTDVSRNGREE